jgi:hypothetical protein
MTPEGFVKAAVKKLLDAHKAYYHMPVTNGMGKPSLDFIGCHEGRFFAVETKAPGKKPTPRQELTIAEIRRAKGPAFVIDGSDYVDLRELREWLEVRA